MAAAEAAAAAGQRPKSLLMATHALAVFDDGPMPTVRGILRRGLTSGIEDFTVEDLVRLVREVFAYGRGLPA